MDPKGWRAAAAARVSVGLLAMLSVLVLPSAAPAALQDGLTQEQLRKMYDDALVQLKGSQDRKAELAGENEKLQARVAELEKQLGEARNELAAQAERTFFLRAHYAAWQTFLSRYPSLLQQWKVFMEADVLTGPHEIPQWMDPDWPLSSADVASGKAE